jgi:hypothetical protein
VPALRITLQRAIPLIAGRCAAQVRRPPLVRRDMRSGDSTDRHHENKKHPHAAPQFFASRLGVQNLIAPQRLAGIPFSKR